MQHVRELSGRPIQRSWMFSSHLLRCRLRRGNVQRADGPHERGCVPELPIGMGQHFCMGYAIARQEAIIACTRLLEAMKNPRPKFETHPGITSPSLGSGGFRSPGELWVQFDVD